MRTFRTVYDLPAYIFKYLRDGVLWDDAKLEEWLERRKIPALNERSILEVMQANEEPKVKDFLLGFGEMSNIDSKYDYLILGAGQTRFKGVHVEMANRHLRKVEYLNIYDLPEYLFAVMRVLGWKEEKIEHWLQEKHSALQNQTILEAINAGHESEVRNLLLRLAKLSKVENPQTEKFLGEK